MATAQDWINATRRHLRAGSATEDTFNTLAKPYTPGDGALTFTQPLGALQNGVRVSAALNTFHIWSVSATTTTASVLSGIDGSNDDALPAGTLVRVKPRWSEHEILQAINDELDSLSSPTNGLFQVGTMEFPYNAAVRGYDLSGIDPIRILEVRYQTVGPWKDWPRVLDFRFERNADTTDFPSGVAIRLDTPAYQGRPVQVVYTAAFSQLGALDDDVSITGMPATAWRLPPIGAAVTCLLGVDVERTRLDTQGNTRRADEVPANSPGAAARLLQVQRQTWLNEEKQRFMAQWPPRMRPA